MSRVKKNKPISRKFWSYLSYLPKNIRGMIVRSQFEIDNELPENLIFKQAETEDEISQALELVYDSYRELDYIDANAAKKRITKFHSLPTTIILIAKINEEVVGTISIIPDSAFGIPSDSTWNLEKFRLNGKNIAEISSLAIKKEFRRKRGKLLFPLFKIMYIFCTRFFNIDGIIAATTLEVEPFYTDILLFEKTSPQVARENLSVKGNPSTCCYLSLCQKTTNNYKKIYAKEAINKNLHKFLYTDEITNIKLPENRRCIQAYNSKQNKSLAAILNRFPELTKDHTDRDKIIQRNIDVTDSFFIKHEDDNTVFNRKNKRYMIKQEAWLFDVQNKIPVKIFITDVSITGLKFIIPENNVKIETSSEIFIFFEDDGSIIELKSKIKWNKKTHYYGCEIISASNAFKNYCNLMQNEFSEDDNIIQFKLKKSS